MLVCFLSILLITSMSASLTCQKWARGGIDDRCCTCYGVRPCRRMVGDESDDEDVEHVADVGDAVDEQAEAVRR